MFGRDLIVGLQVGDGAGYFQDAIVGAGAEIQFGHRDANQLLGFVGEFAVLFDLARAHARVAVDFFVGTKARLLALARATDAIPDRGGAFFGAGAANVAVFHRRNFDMEIDAIEQRSGDSLAVTLDLERTTAAFAFQIAEVSAGTGVHRELRSSR